MSEGPGSEPGFANNGDERDLANSRVGLVINAKFRLDSLLGVGGMAAVYAATHRNGARKALKILHTVFARDQGITDRFLREGYVANRIDHRGRVAIEDDGVTEAGEPFLVMELLEGETAQQLWRRRGCKVTPEETLRIAAEVLGTLVAFHAQNIIHRDIKPANLFVTREGVVKILDFGVARMRETKGEAAGEATRSGMALGTPAFMAPEQAMGLADGVDGRADIFSIGATIFMLVSGQRLHQGRSDNEAFIMAATTPAPSLSRVAPELPVEVVALVDKALSWDRRHRFESAAAMRDECLRVIDTLQMSQAFRKNRRSARRAREERPRAPDALDLVNASHGRESPRFVDPGDDFDAGQADVKDLSEIFRHWERLLLILRQFGASHSEAQGQLRVTHQRILEALRGDGSAVRWKLLPYAFYHRGQTAWEPAAPLDAVPYHLFAAGVRSIEITPGFAEDELRSLCDVMLLDPAVDLGSEDDLVTVLWERGFHHVTYEAADLFADGDAAAREAFWADVEEVAGAVRRAASPEVTTRGGGLGLGDDADPAVVRAAWQMEGALAIDRVTKKALVAELAMPPEVLGERFVGLLADALVNAHRLGDLDPLAAPLDAWARDLVLDRRFDEVFAAFLAIEKAIETRALPVSLVALKEGFAQSMFSPDTVRLIVGELNVLTHSSTPAGDATQTSIDSVARLLERLVTSLGPAHLDAVLDLVTRTTDDRLRRAVLAYLERTMPGHASDVLERLMALELDAARPILKILATARRPSSIDALRRIAGDGTPALRCEAIALLAASPDQIRDDLDALTRSVDPEVRVAALRTLTHHHITQAGPVIERRIQEPLFQTLPVEERRELFSALFTLLPTRAEALSLRLLERHSAYANEERVEQTRALCAEFLGRQASSMEALTAVIAAARPRPHNSKLVRDQAIFAMEAMAARMGKKLTETGDIS